jgi:hypothetical protein
MFLSKPLSRHYFIFLILSRGLETSGHQAESDIIISNGDTPLLVGGVMFRFIPFFLVIFGLFAFGLSAENRSSGSPTVAKKPQKQPTSEPKPYDVNLQKLPAEFSGHDIQRLTADLMQKFPEKSEYETDAVYDQRLQNAMSQSFWGQDRLSNWVFAVSSVLDDTGYDAKKQMFTASIGPIHSQGNAFFVNSDVKSLGRYTGQNAFGVKKQLTLFDS